MQLPPRDPNGHVLVRRLWPGSRWEENAKAGAIVRVPSSIAVRMVLAGDALPVFADDAGAPPSGTLVEAIRAALRNDAEFHALLIGARAYAFHDAGRAAAPRRAGERLRRIIGGLPRALCPASYSAEGFTNTFGAKPAGGWYAAPGGATLPDPRPQGRAAGASLPPPAVPAAGAVLRGAAPRPSIDPRATAERLAATADAA